MNPMEPVTWKKENLMVEHRRRHDQWRKKNMKEERETYQDNAENRSKMEGAKSMEKSDAIGLKRTKMVYIRMDFWKTLSCLIKRLNN